MNEIKYVFLFNMLLIYNDLFELQNNIHKLYLSIEMRNAILNEVPTIRQILYSSSLRFGLLAAFCGSRIVL